MYRSPQESLSRTAMSLAVLSIFSVFVFPVALPYIFGATALIMAVLSKGGSDVFPKRSRTAAIVAVISIAINTFLIVSSAVYFVRLLHDPQLQEQFSELLYRTYGITFEEMMKQLGLSSLI